jgi:hypothetical protein
MVRFALAASALLATTVASLTAYAAPAPAGSAFNISKRAVVPVTKGTSGEPVSAGAVYDRDVSRVIAYNNGITPSDSNAKKGSAPINNEDVTYVARVKICSKTYELIVDTGSSNLWVR